MQPPAEALQATTHSLTVLMRNISQSILIELQKEKNTRAIKVFILIREDFLFAKGTRRPAQLSETDEL